MSKEKYDDKIKSLAIDWVARNNDQLKLKRDIDLLKTELNRVDIDKNKLENELMDCTGKNIPEKFILIDGDIVIVHYQNGVRLASEIIK